jgi:hypothetical protein
MADRNQFKWLSLILLGSLCIGIIAPRCLAAESGAADDEIRSLADVGWESIAADRAPEPGSLAARLGASSDVVDKFVRLAPAAMKDSELLSERSRNVAVDSAGGRRLAHFAELRKTHWYPQVVDMRFAGERLAAALVVFVPRPTQNAKVVEELYLIRTGDDWRISFDPEADWAAQPDPIDPAPLAALKTATDKRRAELLNVVSKPLDQPLDFHGTWTTHFQTSFVYLTFQENGEVFMLQVHGNGTASYNVHDYHLSGDEIVIEDGQYPIRLKHDNGNYWEQDGRRYYGLVTSDAKRWFPDRPDTEPLYLKPVYKGDWPVRRPILTTK